MRTSKANQSAIAILLIAILVLSACGGGGPASSGNAPSGQATSAGPAATTPPLPGSGGGTAAPTTGAQAATAAPAEATTAPTAAAAGPTPTKPYPTPAPGAVTISVVRGDMMTTMRKLADKYQQANPGAIVNVVEEPEGGTFDALIAAGNQPDIFVGSFGSQIGKYAAENVLIPLEDLPGAQDLFARLDKTTVQQLYGHNYYVPMGADVTVMIYNKQLFQEAGLDPSSPPKTWDDFLKAAEKIQGLPARSNGDKVYGTVFWNDALAWGGWYWNLLQPIYLNANQNQCQLVNKLATDIVFDQPQCKMKDFFDFAKSAQKFAPQTMAKNFFSRSIGMWMQYGYSWEPNLKQAADKPMKIGDDVAVAPVPVPNAGDTSYSTYGGRTLAIMKTNPDRQNKAWKFIQFLMQDENNLVFLKELGYLPTLTSLHDDAYFQDPARKPFVDALKTAIMPQQFATAEDVANAVQGVYQQAVVQGTLPTDQAVQQAADKARAALKK